LNGRAVHGNRYILPVFRTKLEPAALVGLKNYVADRGSVNYRGQCRARRKIYILDLDLDLAVSVGIELIFRVSVGIDTAGG